MTNEQINATIAETCGWRDLTIESGSGFYKGFDNGSELRPDLPDYCNDLNAMHEAEESLKGKQFGAYGNALTDIEGSLWGIRATARQRAEAFLRTLGKWEEGK
jgi:hypothetical protein